MNQWRYNSFRISAKIVWLAILFLQIQSASGAWISELSVGQIESSKGLYPLFIEVDTRDTMTPFTVVITNGSPYDEGRILGQWDIDPVAAPLAIIHEGDWPTEGHAGLQLIETQRLALFIATGNFAGTSRRIVVFDHLRDDLVTGMMPSEPVDQWVGVSDSIAFTWGKNWQLIARQQDTVIDLHLGEAASRLFDATTLDYADEFVTGVVDSQLLYGDSRSFSPGLFNPVQLANPEPGTLILLLCSSLGLSGRRFGRRKA